MQLRAYLNISNLPVNWRSFETVWLDQLEYPVHQYGVGTHALGSTPRRTTEPTYLPGTDRAPAPKTQSVELYQLSYISLSYIS